MRALHMRLDFGQRPPCANLQISLCAMSKLTMLLWSEWHVRLFRLFRLFLKAVWGRKCCFSPCGMSERCLLGLSEASRLILFFLSYWCSLESPATLKRLIPSFVTHLFTPVGGFSRHWEGSTYSNVQSVPLARISEALPHSNRGAYVSQLSQS